MWIDEKWEKKKLGSAEDEKFLSSLAPNENTYVENAFSWENIFQ